MPDPTNLEQLQEQRLRESQAAYKLGAVRQCLACLDPTWDGRQYDYLTLVDRLRTVLDAELATLTAPSQE